MWRFSKSLARPAERVHGLRTVDLLYEQQCWQSQLAVSLFSLDRFPGNSEPLTHNGNLRDVRWSSILLATSSYTDASSNISFLMTGSSVTQKI
jgi:hypothetical protein